MNIGDIVKIKNKKQLMQYRINKISGNYFVLDPKPKNHCCNYFTSDELTLLK